MNVDGGPISVRKRCTIFWKPLVKRTRPPSACAAANLTQETLAQDFGAVQQMPSVVKRARCPAGWLAYSSGVKSRACSPQAPVTASDATSRRCGGTWRTNRSSTGKPVN